MRMCLLIVGCLLAPGLGSFHTLRFSEGFVEATRWIGLSKPSKQVEVGAEQEGHIAEMLVAEGDVVSKGDVLFRLAREVQTLQAKRLETLAKSDVDLRRAEAELEEAELEEQRVRDLLNERIRSETDLRAAEHATRLARIMVEKVQVERTRINLEWEVAEARLAQRTVKSPIDGLVARCLYQEGDTIDRLEPVIEIVDLERLWIEFHAPVEHAELFQPGSVFQVRRAAHPGEVREAVIRHASLVADPSSQTFLTRLEMPNDKKPWRAGVKVIIELPTAAPGGAGRTGQKKK